ncbi:MAG: hypothetical protein QOF61_986 [Acidobacteriota bacterium]|jgi:hypothetical protein|nr:hypothetical protein [Acidobacteriota bacterium]
MKQRIAIPKATREQILKEYSHRCARCGYDNPEVHHIDENPSNNAPQNLLPLCPNCHHNWLHNPTTKIETSQLQFFRAYKHPFILKPQFSPLFKRLRFLEDVSDTSDVEELQQNVAELRRLVKAHEMGAFYSVEIGKLLKYEHFNASVSVPFGGSFPQWYIDGKNQERPNYRKQLRENRERVYELIVEMLSYQKWGDKPSEN